MVAGGWYRKFASITAASWPAGAGEFRAGKRVTLRGPPRLGPRCFSSFNHCSAGAIKRHKTNAYNSNPVKLCIGKPTVIQITHSA
jgi:hypothetical protein